MFVRLSSDPPDLFLSTPPLKLSRRGALERTRRFAFGIFINRRTALETQITGDWVDHSNNNNSDHSKKKREEGGIVEDHHFCVCLLVCLFICLFEFPF